MEWNEILENEMLKSQWWRAVGDLKNLGLNENQILSRINVFLEELIKSNPNGFEEE